MWVITHPDPRACVPHSKRHVTGRRDDCNNSKYSAARAQIASEIQPIAGEAAAGVRRVRAIPAPATAGGCYATHTMESLHRTRRDSTPVESPVRRQGRENAA